jgi:hypothetical protein
MPARTLVSAGVRMTLSWTTNRFSPEHSARKPLRSSMIASS